jgi:hypothetical protein
MVLHCSLIDSLVTFTAELTCFFLCACTASQRFLCLGLLSWYPRLDHTCTACKSYPPCNKKKSAMFSLSSSRCWDARVSISSDRWSLLCIQKGVYCRLRSPMHCMQNICGLAAFFNNCPKLRNEERRLYSISTISM